MISDVEEYKSSMMKFYEELDDLITKDAKGKKATSTDLDRAILGLWRIITYNVFAIINDFPDKRKFYAVAGCTRVSLECVADAEYLTAHPDEAADYWKNQEKIKADLNKRADKWQPFLDGSIKEHGQLKDKTLTRIKTSLGAEAIGSYNFLCFYSHPNTAGMFWLLADSYGRTVKYVLQIMTQMLGEFIELLDEKSNFAVDSKAWTQRLDEAFKLLSNIKAEIRI